MSQKPRLITAMGIAVLLALLPATASANVGGASPHLQGLSGDDATVDNVGGASPRRGDELEQENVGGASPRDNRDKNVGGAAPGRIEVQQENVGGASPRAWTDWLLDLLPTR